MNTSPKVSICLPNLNTRPFLPERFESIYEQTLQDWEVVVVDSYSEDGAWEFLQAQALKDKRIRVSQAPRGLYASWNQCVLQARGKYLYFATSDDTMMPRCLEKMVAALEDHPECGLCQCGLEIIDDASQPHPLTHWGMFPFPRFAPDWLDRPHIRRAPLDGILHFALQTVYTSITQIMIKRSVFDRIGLFDETLGIVADFEWGMRAGLREDCVFLPEKLATWRLHTNQATRSSDITDVRRQMLFMVQTAFQRACDISGSDLSRWPLHRLLYFYKEQLVLLALTNSPTRSSRMAFLINEALQGNRHAWKYIFSRRRMQLFREADQFSALKAMLEELDVPAPLFL